MKPVLSISILVSRNGEEVRRCLESLTPLREQLPCEVIVVNTCGSAETSALCDEFADIAVDFEWCDDFAKARNSGLERATGEWFLFIDDDEWFADVAPLVDFFKSGKYKGYGCANYIVRNFHDWAFKFYNDGWASRMIKLDEDTRFLGRIHEYVGPQRGQCINIPAIVNHTGYIMQTDEDRMRKFDRNYPLLLEMVKEEPDNIRWRVQVVQELHGVRRWAEERDFCLKSLDAMKSRTSASDVRDVGTFYGGLVESLAALGDERAAEAAAQAALIDKRMSRLCHAHNAMIMSQMYFRGRKWDKAKAQLDIYEDGVKYYEEHPQEWEKEMGALLLESIFDDIPKKRALSLEIGCALMRGDVSLLEENYDKLGWDRPVIYVSDDFFPALVEAMATLPENPALDRAMLDLWNNRESSGKLLAEIQSYRDRDGEAYQRLMSMTARIGCDVEPGEDGGGEDFRYEHSSMRIARSKALGTHQYAQLKDALMEYGQRAFSIAQKYFRPKVMEEYPELLPDDVYCGVCIWKAFLLPEENRGEEAACFELAAERDEELVTPLNAFLRLSEMVGEQNPGGEDRMAVERIKERAKQCLDGGKYRDALDAVEQFRQTGRSDLDVTEMALRARLGLMETTKC
ncbi:MAG: glycosyltransferase [Clostridiales bacterium]|nr:glycosyltransferase [Clostridiales bacterium]